MNRLTGPAVVAVLLTAGLAHADDKADCIAAFDAGQSLRADGKLTEAIQKFAICARDVCPGGMQKLCIDGSTETSALMLTVVLSAKDAAGHDVDAKVSMDRVVVAIVLDGKSHANEPRASHVPVRA